MRGDERRGSTVYSLYLRLYGQTERRPAHVRRLSRLHLDYASIRVRLSRRRYADVGWVTGHSYIVYGPLSNGAISMMFEGVPNFPTTSRFWEVCDKHKVTTIYTAPTAIRALMQGGDDPVKKTSRKSLRLLGTVGEPINPESLGMVLPRRRRRSLPNRRHLVADRDWRHPYHTTAWRNQTQARLGNASILWRAAGNRGRRGQGADR